MPDNEGRSNHAGPIIPDSAVTQDQQINDDDLAEGEQQEFLDSLGYFIPELPNSSHVSLIVLAGGGRALLLQIK